MINKYRSVTDLYLSEFRIRLREYLEYLDKLLGEQDDD